jgi:L-aspartate semialdehyde sulfurtransferase
MDPKWVRGCYLKNYGPSLMLGVGVPIPVLNTDIVAKCAVQDRDIFAPIVDFSIPRRVRPTFGLVSYEQLKSGKIKIEGRTVRVAPLASIYRSKQVAIELKEAIDRGEFSLTEAVSLLPRDRTFIPQDRRQIPSLLSDE